MASIRASRPVFVVLSVMAITVVMLACSFFRLPQFIEFKPDPTFEKRIEQSPSIESMIKPALRSTIVTAKAVTVTLDFQLFTGQDVLEMDAPLLAPTAEEAMVDTGLYTVPLTSRKGTYIATFPRPTKEPPWTLLLRLKNLGGVKGRDSWATFAISP